MPMENNKLHKTFASLISCCFFTLWNKERTNIMGFTVTNCCMLAMHTAWQWSITHMVRQQRTWLRLGVHENWAVPEPCSSTANVRQRFQCHLHCLTPSRRCRRHCCMHEVCRRQHGYISTEVWYLQPDRLHLILLIAGMIPQYCQTDRALEIVGQYHAV